MFLLSVPAHEGERMRANGSPHNRSQPPLTGSSGELKGILVCRRARRWTANAERAKQYLVYTRSHVDVCHLKMYYIVLKTPTVGDTHTHLPQPFTLWSSKSPCKSATEWPSQICCLETCKQTVYVHICWKPVFCILCFCKPVETPSSWEVEPIQVHQLSISPIFYLERKFTVENHIELLLGDIGRSYYYLLGPAQGRILVEAFEEESCWSRPWKKISGIRREIKDLEIHKRNRWEM